MTQRQANKDDFVNSFPDQMQDFVGKFCEAYRDKKRTELDSLVLGLHLDQGVPFDEIVLTERLEEAVAINESFFTVRRMTPKEKENITKSLGIDRESVDLKPRSFSGLSQAKERRKLSMCCSASWHVHQCDDFCSPGDVVTAYNQCDKCGYACDLFYEGRPGISCYSEDSQSNKGVTYSTMYKDNQEVFIGIEIVKAYPCWKCIDNKPSENGYKVVFDDGIETWFPQTAFQRSYRRITLKEKELVWVMQKKS